jgi:hypothetical protein
VSLILPFDSDAATAQKWKSPKFALGYRSRRARRLASLGNRNLDQETIADPEEFSSFERWRQNRLRDYLGSHKSVTRDSRDELPILPEDTASTLAKRYGASPERLDQALALHSHGLHGKARRLVLCGRLGHRINHQKSRGACHRKFFEPYLCREKYCTFCGPQQFRELFVKLQNALSPIVEKLLCEDARTGREIVIAKLDFTIRNDGHMPTPEEVRKFHDDMRRFWRVAEREFGIKRSEYGVVRCDEIGGNNTNLHGHCGYVGPRLPQESKELSALWSIVLLPKEKSRRRRELMRFARKHCLGELWNRLTPEEQRFVSIKRAKSFAGALAHALKYPAKFLDKSTPQRLAALEATFHKTRRVSTGGVFYRVKELREPGDERESDHAFCPFCKFRLVVVHEQWQPISALEEEGRVSLRTAEREAGLHRALGSESPP